MLQPINIRGVLSKGSGCEGIRYILTRLFKTETDREEENDEVFRMKQGMNLINLKNFIDSPEIVLSGR